MNQLQPILNQRFISLETFRKDGTPVRTPVGFAEESGTLIVRTVETSGKVKRIRANPHVRIAPSTGRGEITGAWIDATASVLSAGESDRTRGAIVAKYGMVWRGIELMRVLRTRFGKQPAERWVAIRITPAVAIPATE
ncbi:hypothetical protein SE17_25375 [Kouleothrix aurantiaca]|uniref:Pyridoxamine 5'-phosphate oxidase N-terminal domain-containing protein n=1 Tax=Kouleothrix aurantiaca TaxID=186479 RepID=A0A0N8PRS0_9CHLR|nr:hypothetical protein SE17_25375 [Kouleothrix aurantiaca]